MKILFIINSLQKRSGSERVACILANEIVKMLNYNVTIINRDTNYSEVAYTLDQKILVEKIAGSQLDFYKGLTHFINQNNPDVVVVHNMGKLSLFCTLVPNIKRLVVLEHVSFISRSRIIQLFSKFLYKKIDQVITLTNSDKIEFDKFHSNVVVIPNFSPYSVINIEDLTKNKNQKNIVAIGRLTDQKNYMHLLKAWEKIFHQLPDWRLCIYGEGEQGTLLNEYIQSNAIQNVFLKGATSDIRSVYESSQFFVMSSRYEGLPMVLIEAQSFGLPIVSYDCPFGPADIVKDQMNGFLVKDQDVQSLADAIFALSTNPALLNLFSRNSLINAQKFQSDRILKIWVKNVFKKTL